ncbi:MAG: MMPL family transporter [Solirubrobacterales bacterium]
MSRRHSLAILFATLFGIAFLGIIGLGVESDLQPTSLAIAGTSSSRGEAIVRNDFGESVPFAVLLRGPAAAIEHQGRGLVAVLRLDRAATTISPWEQTAPSALHPGPDRAVILIDFHRPLATVIRDTVPTLERTLATHIHPPVTATQSGFASISRALQHESLAASERAELLAAPLLIVVLLLVFRSVAAAAIPLAFGAMTVLAGRGILVLLSSLMRIDALSLAVCTMMGLALGVDYSLFIVSRFREELAAGHDPHSAALRARRTAGRTVAFAGSTLFISLFVSAFLQPGTLLVSLATALVVVTAISVAIAWGALPALLTLLGPRINAGRIGRRSATAQGSISRRAAAAATTALRRPALAAGAIAICLALLASPALAFNTGSPGVGELSASNPARHSAEEIAHAVGPGWEAPFVLVASTSQGPITTTHRLALLSRWQRRIASQPGVRTVIGLASLDHSGRALPGLRSLASPGRKGEPQVARLGPGLRRAAGAVGRLRAGLSQATAGSGLLGEGSARARRGAALLAAGLGSASGVGQHAASVLGRAATGAGEIASGQRKGAGLAFNLSQGLRSLLPNFRANGLDRARRLARELKTSARSDPSLSSQSEQAVIVARELESASEELHRLRGLGDALEGGLGRLSGGGQRLAGGIGHLAGSAGSLGSGLGRLGAGAGRLVTGLGALQGGAGSLGSALSGGYRRSFRLQAGLHKAAASAAPLQREVSELHRVSPGFFRSGYLALAAIDGATPARRALDGEAINVSRGGQAARFLIVPSAGLNTEGSRKVGARLVSDAVALGRAGGMRTGVSGGAATLNDYAAATKARLPLVVGAIVLITFLMLLAILRAPLLAALTVALNLVSVGAAIGVVSLACKLPAGYPLGGHPYIDTVGAAAIFGVTFGLSIDYAVFLLARIRERYEVDGDNAAAIAYGIEKTAGVITGAAAIMAAVFISFATSPVATVSQMGVGLTVAILLDATLVRIVLLPALMLLIGDRIWRVPPLLERVLPRLNVHGMGE